MYLEACVSSDDYDLNKWNPIAPHGFFLIAINFTEDGAEAIWAKPKNDLHEAVVESLRGVS